MISMVICNLARSVRNETVLVSETVLVESKTTVSCFSHVLKVVELEGGYSVMIIIVAGPTALGPIDRVPWKGVVAQLLFLKEGTDLFA